MNGLEKIQKMSSREIAELTSKEHKNVLRDCDSLNESYEELGLLKIEQGYYTHTNTGNQQHRECLLTKMQTFDLMTGYDRILRIKVNRRWEELETKLRLPQTHAEALRALADSVEAVQKAERKIAELKPKAALAERIGDAEAMYDIGQVAKIIGLPYGRNTLFKNLRELKIFFKNRNEPKQQYCDNGGAGYFKLIPIVIERRNHQDIAIKKILVYPKGLLWLTKILHVDAVQGKLNSIDNTFDNVQVIYSPEH